MIRKLSAHYIFYRNELVKFGIVSVNEQGAIVNFQDTNGVLEETEKLEFCNGIIVPAFVNINPELFDKDSCIIISDDNSLNNFKIENFVHHTKVLILKDFEVFDEKDYATLCDLEIKGINICLYFSSIQQNVQVEIFRRIKLLTPKLNFKISDLMRWTSINPSVLEQTASFQGCLDIGNHPGLNLISGIDYTMFSLLPISTFSVIV